MAIDPGGPSTSTVRVAPPVLGWGLAAAAALFWSSGGPGIRLAEATSPFEVVLWRSVGLLSFVLAIQLWRHGGRGIQRSYEALGLWGVAAGALLALTFCGYVVAISLTSVANALFMFGAGPLLGAVFGRLWLGEPIRRWTAAATLLAFIGVAVMVADGLAIGTWTGSLAALGAVTTFALYGTLLRRRRAADSSPSVAYAAVISAAVAAAALGLGSGDLIPSPRTLAIGLAMGIGQIGIGMLLFTAAARTVPTAGLMILSMLELVLGPIWVWVLLGEVPTVVTLLGGGLIGVSAVVMTFDAWTVPRATPEPQAPGTR